MKDGSVADFDYGVNLDAGVHGQGGGADGKAGVLAVVAENFDDDIAGAVDDLGLVGEFRRAIDEAAEFDETDNPVEIAFQRRARLGDDVERHNPGAGLTVFQGYRIAQRAIVMHLAIHERSLAGNPQQIAGAHIRGVAAHGVHGLRQGDAEFGKAGVDSSGHLDHAGC